MEEIRLELPELTFRERDHQYFLNGISIPSVSKIIEPVSGAAYATISPYVLNRAAAKGTEVHSAIEMVNKYGVIDISDENRPYLDAYVVWADKYKPGILASETRVYHKIMRYAGTADMLAEIHGDLTLVDFKTSQKIIDDNYRLQMEAYKQAFSTHGIKVERKMILHLKKDGTYDVVEYDVNDSQAFHVFSGCKAVYDWVNRGKLIL